MNRKQYKEQMELYRSITDEQFEMLSEEFGFDVKFAMEHMSGPLEPTTADELEEFVYDYKRIIAEHSRNISEMYEELMRDLVAYTVVKWTEKG